MLGGVYGGFAYHLNIDPSAVRIIMIALLFTGVGLLDLPHRMDRQPVGRGGRTRAASRAQGTASDRGDSRRDPRRSWSGTPPVRLNADDACAALAAPRSDIVVLRW